MYSFIIQRLIDLFSKFPGVGPKTATRFVFYLIKIPKEKIEELIKTLKDLKEKIKICSICYKSFEINSDEEKKTCSICSDIRRDKSIICILEKEIDLEAMEKTKEYKGFYFILGSVISNLDENLKKEIERRVDELIERIKNNPEIKEIIIALNPTFEGENTSLWLKRKLRSLVIERPSLKITSLGLGLPVAGEIEYADEDTLISALKNRKENLENKKD